MEDYPTYGCERPECGYRVTPLARCFGPTYTTCPKCGIGRWIEQLSDNELRIEEGSLYPALYRIEKKGWVDASWGVSDNQRRAKYYKLTAEGRRQLHKNADTWSNFAHAVARVLGSKQQPAS